MDTATLEEVIATGELDRRPARAPDYRAQNAALLQLVRRFASSPDGFLQQVSDAALAVCRAHSTGVSLAEDEGASGRFRWHAVSGRFLPNIWSTLDWDLSPSGAVLDLGEPVLMREPARHYEALRTVQPPIVEELLVPFRRFNKGVGTIWAISHSDDLSFDAEDLRLLLDLAVYAGAGYECVTLLRARSEEREELADEVEALRAQLRMANAPGARAGGRPT